MELHAICVNCVIGLLAANFKRGADLGAPVEVRMVWWGFRALKTPEERSSLPTLQRRRLFIANPVQKENRLSAFQGQLPHKTGADSVRNECSSMAQ